MQGNGQQQTQGTSDCPTIGGKAEDVLSLVAKSSRVVSRILENLASEFEPTHASSMSNHLL